MIYTYDARPLKKLDLKVVANRNRMWDTLHVLAALQGLANRHAPALHVFYADGFGVDTDRFWLDWCRGEDGWLKNTRVQPLSNLEAAARTFRHVFAGLVVYDGRVPATSNAASTAAGCKNLLPVRFDPTPNSVFTLLSRRLKIPVRLWLVNPDGSSKFTGKGTMPGLNEPSSGSAKADVHRWAMARYIDTKRCDPHFAAYYVDAHWRRVSRDGAAELHTLTNHDYFIARRAFFFDLSPWADEAPNDDRSQAVGTDRRILLQLLRALYDQAKGGIIKIGGFPSWPYKYTSVTGGRHEPVATEWEFARLISQFNAYHEADAAGLGTMANASFYQHYSLAERYAQPNPRPTLDDWKAKGFVTAEGKVANKCFVGHYVGDYDAPSWLYKAVPAFFADSTRGQVPLGWAFDPNLSDRAPQALAYAYRHATPNDFFIAGDSGAGYLNPRALTVRPESGLPSGLEAWARYCRSHYARWDMTITGFVLDGSAGASTDLEWAAYKDFSPDGLGTHFESGPALHGGVPACPERDLPDSVAEAAAIIARDATGSAERPVFQWRRSILKSPAWYAELSRLLREKYPDARVEVVDPYTFFGLIKHHLTNADTTSTAAAQSAR